MLNSSSFLNVAHVFLLVISPSSFALANRQVCLTWNATNDEVYFKCSVSNIQSEILLIDNFDYIRANCSMLEKLYCVKSVEGDIFVEYTSENGILLVMRTSSKGVDGIWKCRHGGSEAKIDVLKSKGAVFSTYVHLSGEFALIKNHTKFDLTCFSCWTPYMKSVSYFVNDVLRDSISLNNGKCYHMRKVCKPTECTCSAGGNNFTWSFNDDSSYIVFTCEMRFIDEETSQMLVKTAKLIYNEKELVKLVNGTDDIPVSDEDMYIDPNENDTDSGLILPFLVIFICLAIFGVGIVVCMLRFRNKDEDTINKLIPNYTELKTDDKNRSCHTCQCISISERCADCKNSYCYTCAMVHLQYYTRHRMYEMQPFAVSKKRIHCEKCVKKIADFFCNICLMPCCTSCNKSHPHKGYSLQIVPGLENLSRQTFEYSQETIEYRYTISINTDNDQVRICGIAYIADGRIVIADGNNCKLIVFESQKQQMQLKLEGEPREICAMTGNKIAITFAHEEEIHIYNISAIREPSRKIVSLKLLGLIQATPFSIAHDQGFLAVEVGEGDSGHIIILDNKMSLSKTVSNKGNFAFFTGNTIRLALDMSNGGRIFVSDMGKKMVSCVNFDGDKLWTVAIPSPRSIIILPDEYSSVKRIILSSRRVSAIYELNGDTGKDEIMIAKGKINEPRYMAYCTTDQNLCVQVSKNDREDELVIFYLHGLDDSEPYFPLLGYNRKCKSYTPVVVHA